MRLLLLLPLLALSALPALSQKVEVKKDLIVVDGQPYADIEGDGCGLLDPQCQYFIKDLNTGQRLFVVKQLSFNDPAEREQANPEGQVLYLQFVFTETATAAEIPFPATLHLRPIDVARKVAKAHLIKNGTLDPQAANAFVINNGLPYSQRRQALSQPAPTIIIQNNNGGGY